MCARTTGVQACKEGRDARGLRWGQGGAEAAGGEGAGVTPGLVLANPPPPLSFCTAPESLSKATAWRHAPRRIAFPRCQAYSQVPRL